MKVYYEGEFNGIKYNTFLVNSDGVEMIFYLEPHHTHKDFMKAKNIARGERDVVYFRKDKYQKEMNI